MSMYDTRNNILVKEAEDTISVLIEKYNPKPRAPLKSLVLGHTTQYDIDFIKDGEKINVAEAHNVSTGKREIEIRVGIIDHKNLGNMTVARLKIKDNGKSLGDSDLVSAIEEIGCNNFSSESRREHQIKCLEMCIAIQEELYTLPKDNQQIANEHC